MSSAVTRSIPCSATAAPRMKLPPPMTMATSVGSACSLRISSARYLTYFGEMPNFRSPRRASPESLSSTRLYLAALRCVICASLGLAQGEALDAAHVDVLLRRRRDRRDKVLDRLRGVADVGLLQQLLDARRVHRRDLHRDLLRELLEFVSARNEVGLARQLHQGANASARVDVRRDHALLCHALRSLGEGLDAPLLDERERLGVVAARLLERALAVHDARAALATQALNVLW